MFAILAKFGSGTISDAPDKDYPKTSCRNEIAVGDNGLASSSPPPELKLHEIDRPTKPTITCVEAQSAHVDEILQGAAVTQVITTVESRVICIRMHEIGGSRTERRARTSMAIG